jgi:N-acetylglucosamine-6-phosphate deacetylase
MSEMARAIFAGMQILLEGKWVTDKAIVTENGKIKNIIPKEMIHNHQPAKLHEYQHDHYLIPGLIDLHIHGTHGRDVMDADPDSLLAMTRTLTAEGVTGFLATTMSAPIKGIEAALNNVANVMSMSEGATILGAHLEGPFLAKTKCGAQCGEYLVAPNIDLFRRFQKAARGAIKIVTLAPELVGADELIEFLNKNKVIASIGHTSANEADTLHAIALGCSHATHLFNAMGEIKQREPGAITSLLLADNVGAELIVDGVHLAPSIVELVYRMKGKEGIYLITDAMRAKSMQDGDFDLGGQVVTVASGVARLANGTLAGSTLHLFKAVKNMVAFSGCSLAEAVQMASLNPARALGLHHQKGSIAIGKDADLVVVDKDFNVHLTVVAGKQAYMSS